MSTLIQYFILKLLKNQLPLTQNTHRDREMKEEGRKDLGNVLMHVWLTGRIKGWRGILLPFFFIDFEVLLLKSSTMLTDFLCVNEVNFNWFLYPSSLIPPFIVYIFSYMPSFTSRLSPSHTSSPLPVSVVPRPVSVLCARGAGYTSLSMSLPCLNHRQHTRLPLVFNASGSGTGG